MMAYTWAVILGGAVGAVARYLLATYAPRARSGFSWGIVAANVVGSFILAILTALNLVAVSKGADFPLVAIAAVGVGFCGVLTTFSTFSTDLVGLLRAGHIRGAVIYLGSTVVSSLLLVTVVFIIIMQVQLV